MILRSSVMWLLCCAWILRMSASVCGSGSLIESNNETGQATQYAPETEEDFIIRLGGLFTIFPRGMDENCEEDKIFTSSIHYLQMTLYTLDRVNADVNLLPGVRLIMQPWADCLVDTIALQQVVQQYLPLHRVDPTTTRNNTYWGMIGPETSEVSVPTAKILGLFDVPQISFSATSSVLSDKQRFPYYFRTISSDDYQIEAMIQLLLHNGWDYVSFVHEDDDYGNGAFHAFTEQIKSTSICLAIDIPLPRSPDEGAIIEIVKRLLNEKKARAVIMFATEYNLAITLKHAHLQNAGTHFQWILSDSTVGIRVSDFSIYINDTETSNALHEVFNGAFAFSGHSEKDEAFESHLQSITLSESKNTNPFFADYLSFIHSCSLDVNSTNACPGNLTIPDDVAFAFALQGAENCILAYTYALHNAQQDLCKNSPVQVCDEFMHMTGKDLRAYLQNVSFPDATGGYFSFDKDQNGPVFYDIWRYDGVKSKIWERIGTYQKEIVLNESSYGRSDSVESVCSHQCTGNNYMLMQEDKTCCWHCIPCKANSVVLVNESSTRNISSCIACGPLQRSNFATQTCEDLSPTYLSFEDNFAYGLAAFSCFGLILTILTGITYIFAWDTALIRASGRELSSLMLIGLILAFSVSFFFCFKPTIPICVLRRLGTGLCFTLVYAAILVKTVRISLIFNTFGKRLVRDYQRFLRPMPQIAITLILTTVEAFMLAVWIIIQQPKVIITRSPDDEHPVAFVDCEGMKSHVLLIGLSYPILLVLICTVYAIRIRKVPAGFNEAKHIGFAVYTTLVIWMAQLSTYFVNTSIDIVRRDGIYCLGLSLNALIILLAMFGPKVYIVLLRPEKNNQRMVMGSITKGGSQFQSVSSQCGISPRLDENRHFHQKDDKQRTKSGSEAQGQGTPAAVYAQNESSNNATCRSSASQTSHIYVTASNGQKLPGVASFALESSLPCDVSFANLDDLNGGMQGGKDGEDNSTNGHEKPECGINPAQHNDGTLDNMSVTSQESDDWKNNFLKSYDALVKANSMHIASQEAMLQNDNVFGDEKARENCIDNNRTCNVRRACSTHLPSRRGHANSAYELDGTILRGKSLSDRLPQINTAKNSVITNGSLSLGVI